MGSKIGNFFSWIAMLLAIACGLGLVLAAGVVFAPGGVSGPGAGFGFLFVATWLALLGAGALVTGFIAWLLSSEASTAWMKRRSWIGILVGAAAAAVGFMFGLPFA